MEPGCYFCRCHAQLFRDIILVSGTVEGRVEVEIVNGTLTIRAFDEGGGFRGTYYTLNNVANAKVVLAIINDDVGNCSSPARVGGLRVF